MKISAAIITLNEEDNIARAVSSVSWADETIVVDSGSTDRTVEISESLGAKVVTQEWLGFGPQKQFAVEQCTNDWILSIDADEFVSDELREEIEGLKGSPSSNLANGYQIPRLTEYLGREIRHSGWFPDHQLRFFDKSFGRWKDMVVHESVEMIEGATVYKLQNPIGHRSVKSLIEHHQMIGNRYAPLSAEQMRIDGRTTSIAAIAVSFPLTFIRTYILRLGFLDGFAGFCIAVFAGYNSFLKHLLRWESQRVEDQR